MPLFHANALLMQLMGSLIAGAEVVVAERFRATTWLQEVRESRATVTNGLGVIPEFIFRQPPTDGDRDHRLGLMVAVPIAPEWGAAFEERFGLPFMQVFGMTECNILAYTRPDEALVPGCAGYPLTQWFEVEIVDPDSDALRPAGQVGEIVVRPKVPGCFMAGYFRMPDKTVEAWRNLWFHTGDAGRVDGRGRLHYVDRIKDCIRRRGENISSFEIEQVLNAHPSVAESAVVGIKVAGAGGEDEVKACVVPIPRGHRRPRGAARLVHAPNAVLRGAALRGGGSRRAGQDPDGQAAEDAPAGSRHHRGHLGPRVGRLRRPALTPSGIAGPMTKRRKRGSAGGRVGGADVERHELLVVVVGADFEAPCLDADAAEPAGRVERAGVFIRGRHVEPELLEIRPGAGALDDGLEDRAAEPRAAPLRDHVHAPDVRDVAVLGEWLAMAPRDGDEGAPVERAEREIEIGSGGSAKPLGQHLDRVDLFGRPAERLWMLAQRAHPELAEGRGVVRSDDANERAGRHSRAASTRSGG